MDILKKIAVDLSLDESYVIKIANRSFYYYRYFKIKKKNGGYRDIYQPSSELKTLQYWLCRNIFDCLPISDSAFAYKKGSSIKKHAYLHKNSRFIFHTDICSFFESIKFSHLKKILEDNINIFDSMQLDLTQSLAAINNICFRKNRLCIGAVSSPVISNVIMYPFDIALETYCDKKGYIYSRYADDIYISSNEFINKDIEAFVRTELNNYGFCLNLSKTRFYSMKYRQRVTGLIKTTENKISIGLCRRNEIKKMIYEKLIHGIGDPQKVLGYLYFLKDVEPGTFNNFIIKYSKYCKGDIIDAIKKI